MSGAVIGVLRGGASGWPGADLSYRSTCRGAPVALPDKVLDPDAVEAVVDAAVTWHLAEGPMAGAVVAVVHGEDLLLQKGYGFADVKRGSSMDPESSLVRVGSVSKLCTWTAVMQFVEKGELGLDCDVNSYLERAIVPSVFGKPVTLRNLMTQTSGLEDNCLAHMIDRTASDLEPLAQALERHIPRQVFPPTSDFCDGRFASYSNWGGALAGLIVSRVAGVPFEDYVEANIFSPLGMTASTFREPLPQGWGARMASGHDAAGRRLIPQPFEFHGTFGPAGSLTTTAADMARFMSAHLQGGVLEGQRILGQQTAELMHARAMSPHPNTNGFALGFYEEFQNGRRTIGHGGDTLYFSAQMTLLPEQRVGIFVAYNTRPPAKFRGALAKAVIDEFFPAELPDVAPRASSERISNLGRHQGYYRSNRRSYSTFEKASILLDPKSTVMVRADELGLRIRNLAGIEDQRWMEVESGVFRQESGDKVIAFVGDEGGRSTHMLATVPFDPVHRIRWWQTAEFHRAVLGVGLLGEMAFLALASIGNGGTELTLWSMQLAQGLAWMTLGAVALLAVTLIFGANALLYEVTWPLRLAVTLPMLAMPVAALVGLVALGCWLVGFWDWSTRVLYTLHAVSAGLILWELQYWNLMGRRYP